MIRPGAPGDVAELRALRHAYIAELGALDWQPRHDARTWDGWVQRRLAAGDVRVGMTNGRIAAYITWEVRGSATDGRRLYIDELYVAPAERGRQLGSGLLARALDRARVLGLAEAVLHAAATADATGLPSQFGFALRDGAYVCSLVVV